MTSGALDANVYLQAAAIPLPAVVLVLVTLFTLLAYRLFVASYREGPCSYKVPPPEAVSDFEAWSKITQQLEDPSIKASHSSSTHQNPIVADNPGNLQIPNSTLIQCYAPATGKLLGRINPSSPEGIDRAIAKAQEAQIDWARTTFSQRRRLLRSLLKSVRPKTSTLENIG